VTEVNRDEQEAHQPPQTLEQEGLDLLETLADDIVSDIIKGEEPSESEKSIESPNRDTTNETHQTEEDTTLLAAEQFITDHELDEESADFLLQAPHPVMAHVLSQGSLKGRNLSAMATKRIKVAYSLMDPNQKTQPDSVDVMMTEPGANQHEAIPESITDTTQDVWYWNGKLLKVLRHEMDGEPVLLPVLCSKLEKYAATKSETPDSDTVLDWLISDEKRFTVKFDQSSKLASVTALPSSSWAPSWKRQKWEAPSWKPGKWVWVRGNQESQPSRSSTWRSRSRSPKHERVSHTWW
jgi:hypothetical protein